MKAFLKGLLAILLGLLALGCLGITLCIFNPEMANMAKDMLTHTPIGNMIDSEDSPSTRSSSAGGAKDSSGDLTIQIDSIPKELRPDYTSTAPSMETETTEESETDESEKSTENPFDPSTNKSNTDPANSTDPSSQTGGRNSGYVAPSTGDIAPPSKVSGKTGYQPIEEKQEKISDQEADAFNSSDVGETGDDLSFDATFYPYYYMLDDSGKHLYRQIFANALALNKTFTPIEPINSRKKLKEIFSAVYNDHPELFWLDTSYTCKALYNGQILEINLAFNKTATDLDYYRDEFEQAAGNLLHTAQSLGSDYDKEKYLHNTLIDQIAYATSAPMTQSAYSGLVNGRTVCAGYSRAFQYLMMRLGIPCYYCTGYAGESHAWNIVKLGDDYYNVDLTWDDTEGGLYDYFNKTDNDYADSHARQDLSIYLPPCEGTQYRNLESDDEALTSLSEIGFSPEDVLYDISSYYKDCYEQIMNHGLGNYDFSNVVSGEALARQLLNQYQNGNYENGYMNNVMTQLNATECNITLTAEALQGGNYKMTHRVAMR